MSAQIIDHENPVQAPPQQAVESLPVQSGAASPLDLPAEVFRSGLDRRKENRSALMDWVRSAMVEGVDYGKIHVVRRDKCSAGKHCTNPNHFSKPSLFKPGAEKICGMLGVSVHFPTLHDYEQAALHGVSLVHVIVRCEIKDAGGRVVADGVGARSLKQDYGDINKSLKMAEKSAHIDATLRMAGLSEVFTQDIEDMTNGQNMEEKTKNKGQDRVPVTSVPEREPETISAAQHRRLEARIAELGLERDRVKGWVIRASKGAVQHFTDLTQGMYEKLDAKLEEWAERAAIQTEGATS